MHATHRPLLFVSASAVLWAVGTATAAQASSPVQLQIPFAAALSEDNWALDPADSHGQCAIDGEQALRIERDTSDPCAAANTATGGACFDRLGLGALRARRALLPHTNGCGQ